MSKINETNYPRRTQANYADTDMLVIQAAGGNTYTTRLEDLREDYEETLAPTLSALQDDVNENLATIEAGSTASQAYAKGDFLVFGGRLCKAKTSIAVNATLVLDTNIELASVGGELSSISSDLASVSTSSVLDANTLKASGINSAYGSVTKIGKLVIASFSWQGSISGTSAIINLPVGYRPAAASYGMHYLYLSASSTFFAGSCIVETNGNLHDGTTSNAKTSGSICVAFIAA